MNKFLLVCSAVALLYGENVSALEYNTFKPAQKKTKSVSNNYRQQGWIERFNTDEQNRINRRTPEINGKLITQLKKSDIRFEHSPTLEKKSDSKLEHSRSRKKTDIRFEFFHPGEEDQNWRECSLIVNGKSVAVYRGNYNKTDAENFLARSFLDKYKITKVPGQFVDAVEELIWFLDSTPEKKIEYIDWDKL